MSATVKKQASRPSRPATRYWKGKAPKGVADIDSDSDVDEEVNNDVLAEGDQDMIADFEQDDEEDDMQLRKDLRQIKTMNIALKDVSVSREGKVIVAGREESGRTILEDHEEDAEEESENQDEKEASDKSSDYESSEDEELLMPKFRPLFVPKRARETIAEMETIAQSTEESLKKKESEAEERRKQSHDMVAESIKRELAEKEKDDAIPDIDDTDGLDPAAEFEAWRLRELGRIKKEKEIELQREQELEEIEKRRAMPEEQRLKEDLERAKKLREEKPKGQQVFLQKYWHKGAFHQDDEILSKHDYTQATESTVDVSLLPKVMQVKNFGKRSRTKYTHLLDQDTTVSTGGFGGNAPVRSGGRSLDGGGCFLCGGPHLKKDCPQNSGPLSRPVTGANAAPTAPREPRLTEESRSWRHHDDHQDRDDQSGDRYRKADKQRVQNTYPNGRRSRISRTPSYSRSRSPPRRRDGYDDRWEGTRQRKRSVEDDRWEKRRRVH